VVTVLWSRGATKARVAATSSTTSAAARAMANISRLAHDIGALAVRGGSAQQLSDQTFDGRNSSIAVAFEVGRWRIDVLSGN
jgi:hypothetical protein